MQYVIHMNNVYTNTSYYIPFHSRFSIYPLENKNQLSRHFLKKYLNKLIKYFYIKIHFKRNSSAMIDKTRVEKLLEKESELFVKAHPNSFNLHKEAEKNFIDGVPMNWMVKW